MAIKFNQVTYRYESANNDFYDAITIYYNTNKNMFQILIEDN